MFRSIFDPCTYLVLQRLSGRQIVIDTAYMYYVQGISPSDISKAIGIGVSTVRNYISKISDRFTAKSEIPIYIKRMYRDISSIPQIVENGFCSRCSIYVGTDSDAVNHIMKFHEKDMYRYTMEVCIG